jgi:hypothetical protein
MTTPSLNRIVNVTETVDTVEVISSVEPLRAIVSPELEKEAVGLGKEWNRASDAFTEALKRRYANPSADTTIEYKTKKEEFELVDRSLLKLCQGDFSCVKEYSVKGASITR